MKTVIQSIPDLTPLCFRLTDEMDRMIATLLQQRVYVSKSDVIRSMISDFFRHHSMNKILIYILFVKQSFVPEDVMLIKTMVSVKFPLYILDLMTFLMSRGECTFADIIRAAIYYYNSEYSSEYYTEQIAKVKGSYRSHQERLRRERMNE